MFIESSIPLIRKESRTVKDLIISILSYDFPLSIKKIYNKIKKVYNSPVTHQAVYKVIKQLIDQKIIIKNNKDYLLSKEWIGNLYAFVEQLKNNYDIGNKTNILALNELMEDGKDSQVLTFDSYIDAENYRAKVQNEYLTRTEKNLAPYCCQIHHFKRALIYSTKIVPTDFIHKSPTKTYILCEGSTPIDKWCARFYERILKFKCQWNIKCMNDLEFWIMGDTIIEIHAPKELWRSMDNMFNNAKEISKLSVANFYKEIYLKKRKIQLVIYKNKAIAQQMRQQIINNFKKEKKKEKKTKIVFFDLNGVLTQENTIIEIARFTNNYEKVKEVITSQTLGKMSIEKAFKKVGKLINGISLKQIVDYVNNVSLMPKIREMATSLRKRGILLVIITTGFRTLIKLINKKVGNFFNLIIANDLVFISGKGKVLSQKEIDNVIKRNNPKEMEKIKTNGEIELKISDPDKKTEYLKKTILDKGLDISQCAAVGDSMGDSDMIKICGSEGGLGIAFNPNSSLLEYVELLKNEKSNIEIIDNKDLRKIVPLIL